MSGMLQTIDVSSDKDEMLEIVLQLPFFWIGKSKGPTHYRFVSRKDCQDQKIIGLEFWSYEPSGSKKDDCLKLPFTLNSSKKLANFVSAWLEEAEYGSGTGTDGSEYKGWNVTRTDYFSFITVFPEWIVYGK